MIVANRRSVALNAPSSKPVGMTFSSGAYVAPSTAAMTALLDSVLDKYRTGLAKLNAGDSFIVTVSLFGQIFTTLSSTRL